jgi:hypothetical protein
MVIARRSSAIQSIQRGRWRSLTAQVASPHQPPYRFTIDGPVNVTFVARASDYCALRYWQNGATGPSRRAIDAPDRGRAVRDRLRQTIRLN